MARTLDRWGFEFGKGKRSQHLKEKDEIIALCQKYLRRIRANRDESGAAIQAEIYLDESYVNKNHSNDFIWYSEEDGSWVQKPTGKGERLIINAISSKGWVKDAKLVFQAKKRRGIIMDNVSYHNALSSCSPPTPACTKARIWNWLIENQIPCDSNSLKAELVATLKKIAPSPSMRWT